MGNNGIDVSKWQGDINFFDVKDAGIDFVIIRDGFGMSGQNQIDPKFNKNLEGVQDARLDYGFYHYSYATSTDDAKREAEFCLNIIKGTKPTYPVCFDVEDSSMVNLGKDKLTDICFAFLSEIEKAGYYAMLYCNRNWLFNYLDKEKLLAKFDLWLAHYGVASPSYMCGIWQKSDTGTVKGINGNVDLNESFKDYPDIIKSRGLNGHGNPINNPNTNSTYRVKSGDTLWDISVKLYGTGSRYKEIMQKNGLTSDVIYPGQILDV